MWVLEALSCCPCLPELWTQTTWCSSSLGPLCKTPHSSALGFGTACLYLFHAHSWCWPAETGNLALVLLQQNTSGLHLSRRFLVSPHYRSRTDPDWLGASWSEWMLLRPLDKQIGETGLGKILKVLPQQDASNLDGNITIRMDPCEALTTASAGPKWWTGGTVWVYVSWSLHCMER